MSEILIPNESYIIKQRNIIMAACLSGVCHQLGAWYAGWKPAAWHPDVARSLVHSDEWRGNNPILYFHHNHHDHKHSEWIKFSHPFYEDGEFNYGDPELIDDITENDDEKSYVLDNSQSDSEITVAYDQKVSLDNGVTHTVDKGMHFDVTSKTSIKGSYAGVTVEQEIGLAFGENFDDSLTKAESAGEEEAIAETFLVPSGSVLQLQVTKERARTKQEYDADGILNSEVNIYLDHHWNKAGKAISCRADGENGWGFKDLSEVEQWLHGYNTNHPKMEHYWSKYADERIHNQITRLLSKDTRRVITSGTKLRVCEKNIKLKLIQLEHPTQAAHLPVVDLSDEAERELWRAKG